MDHTGFLTGNLTLDLAIFAWFIAQVIKTLIHFVANRNLDLKRMVGSGDMPSSHSAFVCAATMSIGQVCGWRDPLFSLSAAIALVVMYDACNVRRAAGEQAELAFNDNGPGVPPEQLPRLFDPFYRGDAAHPKLLQTVWGVGYRLGRTAR